MKFAVPQFIEHKAKIVGPLTFRQLVIIGVAGLACLIIYFLIPFSFFLFLAIILLGGGAALAFVEINGMSLPIFLANMFKFNYGSKIYLWKKKEQPITIYKQKKEPSSFRQIKKEENKDIPLKIGENSRLKKMHTNIEIKTR